ncbi:MAG TPA: MFS transporter [Pseudonocardiaceae bacterium]|nr:MFS transporter [Pseudonocardiaceae bacterium]
MKETSGRWWALGALNLAVLAVGLDGTVLTVALPTLAGALHASESDLQWFTSGYLLVLAAAMLPAGLLGDRYGRRTVLLASLALFGLGSAACALAPNPAAFIAARTVVGIAGAGIIVMALASITVLFDEAERPKAISIWSAANFLAAPIGPILGGWLLSHYWWGWVFLINLPVAAIGLAVAAAKVPEYRTPRRPAIDWAGITLSTIALVAITYGLIDAGEHGWTSASTWGPIVGGIAVLALFARYERRTTHPLVDPALFRERAYTWGVLLVAVAILAFTGVLFLLPQFFQGVQGVDAMGSGFRLLPLIGGLVGGAVPASVAARKLGVKVTVAVGFAIVTAGLIIGATTTAESSTGFVSLWSAVIGAGMGLALATASSSALAVLDEAEGGIGSAVLQAVNKVGGPLGAAVLGSVQVAAYRNGVPPVARASVFDGVAAGRGSAPLLAQVRTAFAHGLDAALVVSVGVAVVGLALALVFLPQRTRKEFDSVSAAAQRDLHRAGSTRAKTGESA